MHAFILLSLTATSAFAALSSNGEPIKLAPLQKRDLAATSFNSLFARQTLECPVASNACSDGVSCCPIATTCCLDGCCQALYTCDPTGEGTPVQPCVCFGYGCPDPDNDGGDSSSDDSSTSSSTRSTTSRTTSAAADVATTSTEEEDSETSTMTTAVATTSSEEEDSSATTSTSGDDSSTSSSETSATEAAATGSSTESAASGGSSSGGGGSSAGVQITSMGFAAVLLLAAGSIGVVAFAL